MSISTELRAIAGRLEMERHVRLDKCRAVVNQFRHPRQVPVKPCYVLVGGPLGSQLRRHDLDVRSDLDEVQDAWHAEHQPPVDGLGKQRRAPAAEIKTRSGPDLDHAQEPS